MVKHTSAIDISNDLQVLMTGGKKRRSSKKASQTKKSSKRTSHTKKSSKKQRGGGYIQTVTAIKNKIKAKDSSINMGIPLTTLVAKYMKKNDNDEEKTTKYALSELSSGNLEKDLKKITEEQKRKREEKKANKQ